MNTKKTLADAKHGGCVQLGDELPPLPIRQRFTTLHGETYAYSAEQMREYALAALSAQPSPGGQGDADTVALEIARQFMPVDAAGEWNEGQKRAALQAAIARAINAALAARQPVGEPFGYCADFDPGAHEFSHTFYYLAPGEKVPEGCTPFFTKQPAQAVDLERARNEGHDGAIRYVLGYLCGMGDWGSTQYVEILNGCGRESIIRSAIEDGELEFTGLGRWVEERGTDEERALIASQAVGNG